MGARSPLHGAGVQHAESSGSLLISLSVLLIKALTTPTRPAHMPCCQVAPLHGEPGATIDLHSRLLLLPQIQCSLQDVGSALATPRSSAREAHLSNSLSEPQCVLGGPCRGWTERGLSWVSRGTPSSWPADPERVVGVVWKAPGGRAPGGRALGGFLNARGDGPHGRVLLLAPQDAPHLSRGASWSWSSGSTSTPASSPLSRLSFCL